MGKLGKKARKFAKKNLQSVLRNRRKTKALFKRKSRKGGRDSTEEQVEKITVLSNGRSINFERIHDLSLENVFAENELHEDGDLSESDGYLSEESSCKDFTEIEGARTNEDEAAESFYSTQNEKIHAKLARQMDKLEKLRKKEAFRKICSWEYVNCLDIWVRFVGENTSDHDIQQLFLAIQIINGMARLFPGPRYFPLRLKSIEWLNYLSRSTGAFIPIVSIVLDIFEYKFAKEGRKAQDPIDISSILKLPKHYLKTKTFQERCFSSAIEQLCAHFSQWSCHISFPDLAAVPLIHLKRTFEITTTENLRRMLKRLIDQVEQNVDFIQRKRDEVSFSPHDHQSVDSFLQLEKPSLNTPFMQYYKSVVKQAF